MTQSPLDKKIDDRKYKTTQDCDPKPIHPESLDNPRQKPKEKTVNDKCEQTKRQKIDWQSQNRQNRLDSDIEKSPKKRQNERCAKAFNWDSRDNVRQCKKRKRADNPFEQKHIFYII